MFTLQRNTLYNDLIDTPFTAGEARPMLIAAEKSLKALNRGDVTEVKAMKRPPPGVILVIEAVCIINNVKPHKVCIYICYIRFSSYEWY